MADEVHWQLLHGQEKWVSPFLSTVVTSLHGDDGGDARPVAGPETKGACVEGVFAVAVWVKTTSTGSQVTLRLTT